MCKLREVCWNSKLKYHIKLKFFRQDQRFRESSQLEMDMDHKPFNSDDIHNPTLREYDLLSELFKSIDL